MFIHFLLLTLTSVNERPIILIMVAFVGCICWERMSHRYTRSQVKKEINGVTYFECGGFQNGLLPTKAEVVQNMLYLRPDRAGKSGRTKEDAVKFLCRPLIEHWEYCNVYTMAERQVETVY